MPNSNEKLLNKIKLIKETIKPKNLSEMAGKFLVENIRNEAINRFKKGRSEWHYVYHNDFARDDTVFYDEKKRRVVIDHPAAKRLEYGQKVAKLVITPKGHKALRFIGRNGDVVFRNSVEIPQESFPAIGYVYKAIKETYKDIHQEVRERFRG